MVTNFYALIQQWGEVPEQSRRDVIRRAISSDPQLVHYRDRQGTTLLWHASERDNRIAVEVLLDYGADPNGRGDSSVWSNTPLSCAIAWDDVELVSLLLQRGADPNLTSSGLRPVQHLRSRNGPQILQILLHYGADPLALGEDGTTALFKASESMIPLFIELGVDPSARDNKGRTAVVAHLESPSRVVLLVENGANPNERDEDGRTVLHHLVSEPSDPEPATVRKLVALGADANARTALGLTPMHYAASVLSATYVKVLLKCGAEINAVDNEGRTPRRFVEDGIYAGDTDSCEPEEIGGMEPREYARKRTRMLAFLDTVGARL